MPPKKLHSIACREGQFGRQMNQSHPFSEIVLLFPVISSRIISPKRSCATPRITIFIDDLIPFLPICYHSGRIRKGKGSDTALTVQLLGRKAKSLQRAAARLCYPHRGHHKRPNSNKVRVWLFFLSPSATRYEGHIPMREINNYLKRCCICTMSDYIIKLENTGRK